MFSANSRYTPARFERFKSQDTSNESETFRLADGSYSIDADPECFMVIINFLQVWFISYLYPGFIVSPVVYYLGFF